MRGRRSGAAVGALLCLVRMDHSGQAMCNQHHRPPALLQQLAHRILRDGTRKLQHALHAIRDLQHATRLHQRLRLGVECARRLVKQHDPRSPQQNARDGYPLLLHTSACE